MSRKSILGVVALAAISLLGALAPPAGASVVTGGQTTLQLTGTTAVKPLVGDFNGDGADDVFWYGAASAPDSMWFNSPIPEGAVNGEVNTFTTKAVTVNGNYTPFVGDFNGDRIDDVFWYAAGTGADSVWYFKADKSFTSVAQRVDGSYRPIVGNFDTVDVTEGGVATEQDDILWYPLTQGNSSLWSGNANKTFSTRVFGARAPQGAKTLLGEFELGSDDLSPDILFYVPGSGADSMWISDGTGNFVRTAMTINGSFRPIVGNFDKTGFRLPLPAEAIDSYGDAENGALDALADGCFNGDLGQCDDLHEIADSEGDLHDYHDYAETCGGRRSPGIPNCATQTFAAPPVGLSDIVWHGPGADPDKVWINNGEGFASSAITIGGTATATVIPSGPGGYTGGDRILWNDPSGADSVWVPSHGGSTFGVSGLPEMGDTRRPLAGDFASYTLGSQYRQNEVLWYAPGNTTSQKETIWLTVGGLWP